MNRQIILQDGKNFKDCGLDTYLIRCYQVLKYIHPTPIQYYSIKTYLNYRSSIIAQSKSGTGKTLSYISIILIHIIQNQIDDQCRYLILLPTRELAIQVYQNFKDIINVFAQVKGGNEEQIKIRSKLKRIKIMMSIGGIPFEDDRRKYIQYGCNIMIGTIGRVIQMMDKRLIKMGQLNMMVLDEGDKILQNKNKKSSSILDMILQLKVDDRYKVLLILYSATLSNKLLLDMGKKREYIFIQTLMNESGELNIKILDNIDEIERQQRQYRQQNNIKDNIINLQNINKYKMILNIQNNSFFNGKIKILIRLLSQLKYQRCLIFVEKKTLIQQINQCLISSNLQVLSIHGSLSQSSRIKLMNQINTSKIILASDLLARGIDIQLDLVILFDAKNNDTFWHRIGRTGRYNKMGVVISLDNIQGWQQYNRQVVQAKLEQIGHHFNRQKQWYGKYLTEIGRWNDADNEKQKILNQQYKYFDQQKYNNKIKRSKVKQQNIMLRQQNAIMKQDDMEGGRVRQNMTVRQSSGSNHEISNILDRLNKIVSEIDLINFLQQFKKCRQCLQLIQQITLLTGYNFKIKEYIK